MLFTATVAPRSQTTSQIFKDHGNNTDVPSVISDVNVVPVRAFFNAVTTVTLSVLWAFVSAHILGETIDVSKAKNSMQKLQGIFFKVVENPPLVITFAVNGGEGLEERMRSFGFTRQSANKYKYYKGPASDEVIQYALQNGGNVDAYSVYGTANMAGIFTISIMNRVLGAAFGFLCQTGNDRLDASDCAKINGDAWEEYVITGPDSLSGHGIFFPYFDGLLLPDKAHTPSVFLSYFSLCFGTPKEIMAGSKTVMSGWSSVSTTPAGLVLSHLVFGLDLAIKAACRIRPVYFHGTYSGFVLEGQKFIIFKNSTPITPYPKEQIAEEFSTMDSHRGAVTKLAEIISAVPLTGKDKERVTVDPLIITSPRHLHYLLKDRNFDIEQQKLVRDEANKLKFDVKYYDLGDRGDVTRAIEFITRRNFLPVEAPFVLQTGSLFTKDTTLSTLAAFGLRAPTLIGSGNNAAIPIVGKKKYLKNFKGCALGGVPIFSKPLQQSFEDWETLLRTGVITFKHNKNDKNGVARVNGLHSSIPFDTPECERILTALDVGVYQRLGKRGRGEEDDNDADTANVRGIPSAKKLRKGKETADSMAMFMPIAGPSASIVEVTDEGMDEDIWG